MTTQTESQKWEKAIQLFEDMHRAYVFCSHETFKKNAIKLGDFLIEMKKESEVNKK